MKILIDTYSRDESIMLLDTGVQPIESTLRVAAQYSPQLVPLFLEKGVKPTDMTLYVIARYSPQHVNLVSDFS